MLKRDPLSVLKLHHFNIIFVSAEPDVSFGDWVFRRYWSASICFISCILKKLENVCQVCYFTIRSHTFLFKLNSILEIMICSPTHNISRTPPYCDTYCICRFLPKTSLLFSDANKAFESRLGTQFPNITLRSTCYFFDGLQYWIVRVWDQRCGIHSLKDGTLV